MAFTPAVQRKLKAISAAKSGVGDSVARANSASGGGFGSGVGAGRSRGAKAGGAEDADAVELRLTPTTLRRVVLQRDKLEEEAVELRSEADALRTENQRLIAALAAHALCGQKIIDLEDRCTGAAQVNDKAAALRKQIEDLELALKSSEQLRLRVVGRAATIEELETELKAARAAAMESAARAAESERKRLASESDGPTQADFTAMVEMYKAEQLMLCVSERVFVHVVAPKAILQVGSGASQEQKEYHPPFPSEEKVKDFIRREIEPHFEMVFKTLDKQSGRGGDLLPRTTVEGQKAPDGTSVRAYAERFNSTLSNFIQKCLRDS